MDAVFREQEGHAATHAAAAYHGNLQMSVAGVDEQQGGEVDLLK